MRTSTCIYVLDMLSLFYFILSVEKCRKFKAAGSMYEGWGKSYFVYKLWRQQ